MSIAVAKAFIEGSKLVTKGDYSPNDESLLKRVQDISGTIGSLGRYIDVDGVDWGKNDTYFTGEVSDCTAFAIRRGDTALFSHVQGLGDVAKLKNAITAFKQSTRRISDNDSLYLWTMHSTNFWGSPPGNAKPVFSPVNYDGSSTKVIVEALLGAYGPVAIQVLPKLTTIVTGKKGVGWNGYCVAFVNGAARTAGGIYQRNSATANNNTQGLVLANYFRK